MTTKISSTEVSQLLNDAANTLRKTAEERDQYKMQCETMERRQQVEKLASLMHTKGLDLDTSVEDLADRLEKAASGGHFEAIKRAVDFVGPDMSQKLAALGNEETRGNGASDLERYIVGGVG